MNRRQRNLLVTAGVLLAMLVGFAMFGDSSDSDGSNSQLAKVEREIEVTKRKLRKARAAVREIGELEQRALPADRQLAADLYQEWWFNAVERVPLRDWNIDLVPAPARGKALDRIGLTIQGKATLPELVRLLHTFYGANFLHQIRHLRVQPIEGTKDLELSMLAEAASLPGVIHRKTLPDASPPESLKSLGDYLESIGQRNIFAPANNPPLLASIGPKTAVRGRTFTFKPQAKDSDPLDQLRWSLEGEPPAGVRIDQRTGVLTWTPTEKGTYQVTLRVADDGVPVRAATATIAINVVDPSPTTSVATKPNYERAKFAFLISTIQVGRDWQLWIHERTADQIHKVPIGGSIEIGPFRAEVAEISASGAKLIWEGRPLSIAIGTSLAEAAGID